jgi:hypothetical protein
MTCATTARRRRIRYAPLYCLLAGVALAAPGAAAEEARPSGPAVDRSEWEDGWHVVRPGDTLEGLAARFLGSHELWRDLHLLNPLVKDPNLLFPGQRLRIFLERPTAKLSAQIMAVARDVRELPTPVPWQPASEGDVLLERDALRTAKAASARLRFDDGATVTLSEDSLVFIRRQTAASSPLPKKEIEIQLGQIDVESSAGEGRPSAPTAASAGGRQRPDAIEVVVGGARSLATPTAGEPLSTRSRKGGDDQAQFMIYAGKSTVSAAGASIDVPAGSGTSVAPKAKPGPVEALLPAPADARPAYGEEIEQATPQFSWSLVTGADHYTVEVCRDPACGALVARVPVVTTEALQLDVAGGLPAGELFWRVTAVAPSGLDGFPTPAIRVLAVESVRPDSPQLVLESAAGAPVAAGTCFGAAPEAIVHARDRRGAELPWTLLLDGRAVSPAEFRNLPLAGEHKLAARVTDARGRTADSSALAFTLDGAAPWVDLVALSAGAFADSEEPAGTSRRRARKPAKVPTPVAACDSGLEAEQEGGFWIALPCATAAAPSPLTFAVDPARPAVTLRASAAPVAIGDSALGAGALLNVAAWDVGCGVNRIALRIVPSPYSAGRMLLEAEVTDGAGNRRTQGWHVARR